MSGQTAIARRGALAPSGRAQWRGGLALVWALALALLAPRLSQAARQPGKDGPLTVAAGGTVVNAYAVLAADVATGATSISVTLPAGGPNNLAPAALTANDLLLVIQMQGATIDTTDTVAYGRVTSYGNAGRWELVSVSGPGVGGPPTYTIPLAGYLRNSYTAAGRVQVVKVPQYSSLTVDPGGSIDAPPWMPAASVFYGGVVALDVQGTATVNGILRVANRGFWGGQLSGQGTGGSAVYRSASVLVAAEKGESIAGNTSLYDGIGGRYGRGAPANGGGGGNRWDSAGGGGANASNGLAWSGQGNPDRGPGNSYDAAWNLDPTLNALATSSGGGRGGYSYSDSDQDALAIAPGDAAWAGDQRRERGGLGGHPVPHDPALGRLFFGGGGGAGAQTNANGGAGGRGGGILFLFAGTVAGTGSILARGQAGFGTSGSHFDAPGGGGGGGTVVVQARTSLTLGTIDADGGDGGNHGLPAGFPDEAEGGGGGGGGGYVYVCAPSVTIGTRTADGGANGTTASAALTEFPPNGGTRGAPGIANAGASCIGSGPPVLTFTDVSSASGLNVGGNKSGGLAWGDFNADDCPDAIVNSSDGVVLTRLLAQDKSGSACLGTFVDVTQCLAGGLLATLLDRAVAWGDYDNDGWLDFARSHNTAVEVYRNGGPGATVDVSCPAGSFAWSRFGAAGSPTQTLVPGNAEGIGWIDFDADGDLDLFVDNADATLVATNNPTGTLTLDLTTGLPASGSGNGDYSAVADYDADGDVDVLARKDDGRSLWWNDGSAPVFFAQNLNFTEAALGGTSKGGVAFCDFDDDGDFDVFWTDYPTGVNQVWRNNGGTNGAVSWTALGTLPTGASDVDGVSCGDLDNDGDVDLMLNVASGAVGDYVFRNDGGFTFTNVSPAGLGTSPSPAGALADYDRDGDLDLLVNQGGGNQLWRNEANDKSYLMVRALHDLGVAERDAIGATVQLRSCSGTPVSPVKEVSGGSGHGSQDSALVHFGLRRPGFPTGPWSPYVVRVKFVGGGVVQKAVIPSTLGCYQQVTIRSTDADELAACAATPVTLESWNAAPLDAAVELAWKTASELRNLGFHLYRASSAAGPWTRITASLVPGLGSSAIGRSYSFRDGGLVNGVRYYYELEDVDASGTRTRHGPVSATPVPGAAAAPNAAADPAPPAPERRAAGAPRVFGDPSAVELQVLRTTRTGVLVELRTGGFLATADPGSGRLRITIPGFEPGSDPHGPALPLKRVLLDGAVGRRAKLASIRELDVVAFPGLVPEAEGFAEMAVTADGTVRPRRKAAALRATLRGLLPAESGRLGASVFLGDDKKLVLELQPLRFDPGGRRLLLARRLRAFVSFGAREPGERGAGTRGRKPPWHAEPLAPGPLAFVHVAHEGLQAVSFEQLLPGRREAIPLRSLKLARRGAAVPFHVAPAGAAFGPGSQLLFFADAAPASTAFSGETAYALSIATDGVRMASVDAAPAGAATAASRALARFETNRFYQPGLVEAPDLWLWEGLVAGATKTFAFSLAGVPESSPLTARLSVALQGASDPDGMADHHVRAFVNGVLAGERGFDGRRAASLDVELAASLLREGPNELRLESAGAPASYVFLDRFSLAHPQVAVARDGRFEGTWATAGTAEVAGLAAPPAALVEIAGSDVRWLRGAEWTGTALRFRVEAGGRTVVASAGAIAHPRVTLPTPPSFAETTQADYVLIAPRAFLAPARRLLDRRAGQGLSTLAVPLEEIADRFGHGAATAEAIRAFLAHAFHRFAPPSPRYVLLLGGSTYDPRNFTGRARPSPLPPLVVKTSYLWTVSDSALAAVNGDDTLADLAIGRLPASTLEEAERLVDKLLAWEDGGGGLDGRAVLVADNPDAGGDFEANQLDIQASFLAGRDSELVFLSALGPQTRPAILEAFDAGASLMSYVGHGGAAVWASENVLNSWDAATLRPQSRQPVLLTLNCLNGYFLAPGFDSIAEAFLKAEGRGSIAGFSPSGLSLDAPAHLYHRALVAELLSQRHERLGDAFVAAQKSYAETGAMPELLSIYHLLGDPATRLRH